MNPHTSDARRTANQANAQHSTGPRTPEGRAASSRNNLRHGFRSQTILLPGDDPAEYEALLAELTGHYQPRDLTENRFIREMADAEWQLRRVRNCMEEAICRRIEALALEKPDAAPAELQLLALGSLQLSGGPSYSTWLRYETKFERQYDRAYSNWMRYQAECRRAAKHEAQMNAAAVSAADASDADALPYSLDQIEQLMLGQLQNMGSNVQTLPDASPEAPPAPLAAAEFFEREAA